MHLALSKMLELANIQARIVSLHNQAFSYYPLYFDQTMLIYREELEGYKIKLEQFFSETDIKVKFFAT